MTFSAGEVPCKFYGGPHDGATVWLEPWPEIRLPDPAGPRYLTTDEQRDDKLPATVTILIYRQFERFKYKYIGPES